MSESTDRDRIEEHRTGELDPIDEDGEEVEGLWDTIGFVDETDRQIQLLFADVAEKKAWEQLQQVEQLRLIAEAYWTGCCTRRMLLAEAGKAAN